MISLKSQVFSRRRTRAGQNRGYRLMPVERGSGEHRCIQRAILAYVALFSVPMLSSDSPAAYSRRHITVNVLVSDSEGHTVSGLDRSDFLLADNGEHRTISTFKVFQPAEHLVRKRSGRGYWISNGPNIGDGSKRPTTVILLDTQNTSPQYQPWSIGQMARVAALLGPEEQIAVYQLRQDGLFLLHEFTGDRAHLLAAIAPEAMVQDALTNKWRFDYKRLRVVPALPPGSNSNYRALERLACQMSRYPGRKNLFWISADFPKLFPYGKATEIDAVAIAAARALEASGVTVFPVDVRSPVPPMPFQPAPPVTGKAAPVGNNRDFVRNMNAIADATGGKAIVNRPELAEAIVDTMRSTQRSYELGFDVPADRLDGSYHKLRVQLRRSGLAAIYNRGYFAQVSRPCSPDALFDSPEIGISVRVSPNVSSKPSDENLLLQIRLFEAGTRGGADSGADAKWQLSVKDADSGAVLASATGSHLQLDLPVKVPGSSRLLRASVREERSGRIGTIAIPLDVITRAQIASENTTPH